MIQADLGAIRLFRSLPADELSRLNELARPRQYRAGELVVREGEDGVGVYVVTAGSFEIRHDYAPGDSLTEATLGPGDIFGLTSMLDDGPRRASVYAVADGECLI